MVLRYAFVATMQSSRTCWGLPLVSERLLLPLPLLCWQLMLAVACASGRCDALYSKLLLLLLDAPDAYGEY